MTALDLIYRILRTRVSATVEEHEQIMTAFNEIANAIKKNTPPAAPPRAETADDDLLPMPGTVSSRPAS